MATLMRPGLLDELRAYGAADVAKCFNCGTCSAVCVHSEAPYTLPRRPIHYLQLGLESKLEGSLEPWLCYYCGECSEQCPKQAEPGETMMSLRRWLTSRYDVTGLSRLFYRSWKAEFAAILALALVTAAGFLVAGFSRGDVHHYDGPQAFLPAGGWTGGVHLFDWGMAGVLSALLLVNAARMWWLTLGRDRDHRAPLASYLAGLYVLPLHFFTQRKYAQCERKRPWVVHLALMLSYVTMLVLIMFFLRDMASGPGVDWRVHVPGLLAAAGLLTAVIVNLRGRIRRSSPHHAHSHESDWIFLVLLLYVTLTGVLQFILHRVGLDLAANLVYVAHLAGVVPMLVLEVPFGKWSHLAYRPLALYFARVREHAAQGATAAAPDARAA